MAGSTQLVMLNISGCISLFGLLLPNHEHLTCLTASGCKQMRTINCASPALETCLTQSCLRLEVGLLSQRTLLSHSLFVVSLVVTLTLLMLVFYTGIGE